MTPRRLTRLSDPVKCIAPGAFRSGEYLFWIRRRRSDHALHIQVARVDKHPIEGWDILQAVKNEVVGENFIAVEFYPAEKSVVDQHNIRHLWVFPERNLRKDFGLRCLGNKEINYHDGN
jgi:hypothetical protein